MPPTRSRPQQLLRLPESFPFTTRCRASPILRTHEGFNIHRQGLDMDMVAPRKVKLETPPKRTEKPSKAKPANLVGPTLFDRQTEDSVQSNGRPDNIPAVPVKAQVDDYQIGGDERRRIEISATDEVVPMLSEPADQFPEGPCTETVLCGPFASTSIECAKLFRDGHYLGCIALSQVVLEAMIRHIWQVRISKKTNLGTHFDKNLEALHKKKFISDEWKSKLDRMWAGRHSFHHLRPSVKSDQRKLEETARNTLKLLDELEREFFGFTLCEELTRSSARTLLLFLSNVPALWIRTVVPIAVCRKTGKIAARWRKAAHNGIRWIISAPCHAAPPCSCVNDYGILRNEPILLVVKADISRKQRTRPGSLGPGGPIPPSLPRQVYLRMREFVVIHCWH